MVPQTKVFVGSLAQGSKPEDLRKLFEKFGVVTECDIMNRCGFVHMQTEDQASAAIRALNNTTFNGGVITVERGRIKERGGRGGGRGGRGGMRSGGMDRRGGGGPMRGGHMGNRDAPYMRDSRPMGGHMRGDMRGQSMGGGMGGGYDRGMDRSMGGGAGYVDDRYGNGYGGEDRRGFALNRADPYSSAAPMYQDDRRGYGEVDDMQSMYPDDRRGAGMYGEEMMDRRAPMRGGQMSMAGGYDRGVPPQRQAPMGNGDMFSRRSPMAGGGMGGYERDPYAQQYPAMGRGGGGGAGRGGRDGGGMGPRRY